MFWVANLTFHTGIVFFSCLRSVVPNNETKNFQERGWKTRESGLKIVEASRRLQKTCVKNVRKFCELLISKFLNFCKSWPEKFGILFDQF